MPAPSRAPKIKIISVLVAEDLRQEVNGQQTIVGVFGWQLNSTSSAFVLPRVVVRIDFTSDASGPFNASFSVVSPNGSVVFTPPQTVSVNVKSDQINTFAMGWGPAKFAESGQYEIKFGIAGRESRVATLQVNTNVGQPRPQPG